MYAIFAAPADKKAKKTRWKTAWDDVPAENLLGIPLPMEMGPELGAFEPANVVVTKLKQFTNNLHFHFKNRTF